MKWEKIAFEVMQYLVTISEDILTTKYNFDFK